MNYKVPACEFSALLGVLRNAHCGINIGDCRDAFVRGSF